MSKTTARLARRSSFSIEELKEWIEAVPYGTCVTLPNGTVIDKRGLPSSWWYTSPNTLSTSPNYSTAISSKTIGTGITNQFYPSGGTTTA